MHTPSVWHGFDSRNSIVASLASFVTGSSHLLAGTSVAALGHAAVLWCPSFYTRLQARLVTSPFLSYPVLDGAPLFLVHNGQLLHRANESHILYVNALNVTRDSDTPGSLPYRLTLANRRDGLLDAVWRWRGAFLHLDNGEKSYNGLYYKCESLDEGKGVYTSFELYITP